MKRSLAISALLTALLALPDAAAQQSVTVTITEDDCTRLVEHVPADDVAYRAGVDVDGAAVTPADLGGGTNIPAPKEIEIPIQLDLQAKMGVPANPGLYQTKDTTVGIAVWREGRVWYNGEPLGDPETARIAALCRETLEKDQNGGKKR